MNAKIMRAIIMPTIKTKKKAIPAASTMVQLSSGSGLSFSLKDRKC